MKSIIFLISQPRAGSTMTQKILAAHTKIHTSSEPWVLLPQFSNLPTANMNIYTEYNYDLFRKGLSNFLSEKIDWKEYNSQIAEAFTNIYKSKLKEKVGAEYFLDKTPRYYSIIPEIRQNFPTSKIVLLLRNPIAVLNSIMDTWVKDDYIKLNQFYTDLLVAPFKIVEAIKNDYADFTIQFEQLLHEPVDTMKRLCSFIGVEFEEEMISYGNGNSNRWVLGDTRMVDKRKFPDKDNSERWLESITTYSRLKLCIDYMDALGPEVFHDLGYDFDLYRQKLMNLRVRGISITNHIKRIEYNYRIRRFILRKLNFIDFSGIVNRIAMKLIRNGL